MGIKGLSSLLKKKFPSIYVEDNISSFAYKTVAVDFSIYAFKFKAIAGEKWLSLLVRMLSILQKNDVHIVLVFDGKAPKEKQEEREKRRDTQVKLEERAMELHEAIEKYHTEGVVSQILYDTMEKRSKRSLLHGEKRKIDIKFLEDVRDKMESQIVRIEKDDVENAKRLAELMGIQCYQSENEAETACACLCVSGEVDAALTEDSDILAYGTPISIMKYNWNTGACCVIDHSYLVDQTGLSIESFRDLCVLCGNDYNSNIKGVGPVNALRMIKIHKDIDKIAEKQDVEILNHERSRELFTPVKLDFEVEYKLERNVEELDLFLVKNNCQHLQKFVHDNYHEEREIDFEESEDDEDILS